MTGEPLQLLQSLSASLTKSSNIIFLIWCLMAIVAGSLSRLPNRCVCVASSWGAWNGQLQLLLAGLKQPRCSAWFRIQKRPNLSAGRSMSSDHWRGVSALFAGAPIKIALLLPNERHARLARLVPRGDIGASSH